MKKFFKWMFILEVIWINIFTIDYMLVYNNNKPLFYWDETQTKETCGDKLYAGLGYMIEVERYIEGNIFRDYTCHETGRFKVCPLFTECLFD